MGIAEDRDDLTRVGPGTVMGEFMRQYWIPALGSDELEPDGDPQRLMLLGEKLIAFRDSSGKVGVLDHLCPHRCASMFLGRNEEGGLRCVYHGWKFDTEGRALEIPNLPPAQEEGFKQTVKAKSHRVEERNGLIWVYMGGRETPPPLPMLEATMMPIDDMQLAWAQRDCNWLQSLEGDIDTSHFGFLHAGHLDGNDFADDDLVRYTVVDRAPEYHAIETDWGTSYGAHRETSAGETYWRVANYLFPFWSQTPAPPFANNVHARAWVPMDDEHTMCVHLGWKGSTRARKANATRPDGTPIFGLSNTGLGGERDDYYEPNTTDWYGRWRLTANEGNDWKIDREAQRIGEIYTGIDEVHLQDQAVTESMGAITDHTKEHLVPSDRMIVRTRRRILHAARNFAETGFAPGVDDPDTFADVRSGFFTAAKEVDWQDAYREQSAAANRPVPADA